MNLFISIKSKMFNNIYVFVLQNDSFINDSNIESNTSSAVYSENEKNVSI